MEALGALAVAERDIRALRTARADRARSGDYGLRPATPPRPSSPPGYVLWRRLPTIQCRDGRCTKISPGGL